LRNLASTAYGGGSAAELTARGGSVEIPPEKPGLGGICNSAYPSTIKSNMYFSPQARRNLAADVLTARGGSVVIPPFLLAKK
jgi:hypothetical protein